MAYIIVLSIVISLALIPSVQEIIRKWLYMLDYVEREKQLENKWEEAEREISVLFDKQVF